MTPTHILVIDGGWVLAGTLAEHTPDMYQLADAAVIRRWGTTRGLGQLAAGGPTTETKLDPCGTALVAKTRVLFSLVVTCKKAWL